MRGLFGEGLRRWGLTAGGWHAPNQRGPGLNTLDVRKSTSEWLAVDHAASAQRLAIVYPVTYAVERAFRMRTGSRRQLA